MEHVIPVVSYARISYDKAGDAHGVADQHKVNRETSARLGWTVVHEFTDNDRSASKAEVIRDGFEAMLKAAKAGRLPDGTAVQGVVVVAEDRLARRSGDYERFVDALTAEDGRVYADARGRKDLYSEDVEGMGLVGVAFAKIESRKVRRRVRRSHRARAELGIPVGSQRPFGWQADKLTLDPAEAPLVAAAVDQFIAGRSINSMVREWNDRGVVTAKGNRWTIVGLRQVLGNPRLCGWRKHNGELVTDAAGNPVVGRWEPIVTPEQWRAVEAILTARAGRRIGSDGAPGDMLAGDHWEHRYLLTGVLRCGRPRPDGTLCNPRLRVRRQRDCARHLYASPRPRADAADWDAAATRWGRVRHRSRVGEAGGAAGRRRRPGTVDPVRPSWTGSPRRSVFCASSGRPTRSLMACSSRPSGSWRSVPVS